MYVLGIKENIRRYKSNNMEPVVLPIIQEDEYVLYFCFGKALIYVFNWQRIIFHFPSR